MGLKDYFRPRTNAEVRKEIEEERLRREQQTGTKCAPGEEPNLANSRFGRDIKKASKGIVGGLREIGQKHAEWVAAGEKNNPPQKRPQAPKKASSRRASREDEDDEDEYSTLHDCMSCGDVNYQALGDAFSCGSRAPQGSKKPARRPTKKPKKEPSQNRRKPFEF